MKIKGDNITDKLVKSVLTPDNCTPNFGTSACFGCYSDVEIGLVLLFFGFIFFQI